MNTYFITTQAPSGKRGGRGTVEKFVVIAANIEAAKLKALAVAHPNGEVTSAVLVDDIKRVAVL